MRVFADILTSKARYTRWSSWAQKISSVPCLQSRTGARTWSRDGESRWRLLHAPYWHRQCNVADLGQFAQGRATRAGASGAGELAKIARGGSVSVTSCRHTPQPRVTVYSDPWSFLWTGAIQEIAASAFLVLEGGDGLDNGEFWKCESIYAFPSGEKKCNQWALYREVKYLTKLDVEPQVIVSLRSTVISGSIGDFAPALGTDTTELQYGSVRWQDQE